jgi:DNA polymerase-3 subunit gamma/tau
VAVAAQVEDLPRGSETEARAEPGAAAVAVAVVDADTPELSLESFNQVWPAVLERLAADSPMLAGALGEARPAALGEDGLTIAWPEASALTKRQAEDPAKRELLAAAIRSVTGASLRLAHEVGTDHEISAAAAAGAGEPRLSEDQLVERFMAEFDAEELPPEQPPPPQES